jgi:hypothetical protein
MVEKEVGKENGKCDEVAQMALTNFSVDLLQERQ